MCHFAVASSRFYYSSLTLIISVLLPTDDILDANIGYVFDVTMLHPGTLFYGPNVALNF